MSSITSARIKDHFVDLTDPRRRKVTYPLINVVTITLCAVICGADDFVSIAAWGHMKRGWLAKLLDLSSGIPSHDRFNAILAAIKPAEFEKCLLSWITALHEITDGQLGGHRRQDAAAQLRHGQQQIGDSHGQCLGHGQSHQPGPGGGCPVPKDLPDRTRWSGLKAIGIVISSTQRNGKDCGDVRYRGAESDTSPASWPSISPTDCWSSIR
jgi:hypothetical protein